MSSRPLFIPSPWLRESAPMPARKSKTSKSSDPAVVDYRHGSKRKNIPPAGLAAQGKVKESPKLQFAYNPHLPPVLRFDDTGKTDKLPALLEKARKGPLTADETKLLVEALRNREPWLEWAGKREKKGFDVDPVAVHIHERISTQAILKVAARLDATRDMFADPQQEYQKAVQFYQHDVAWSNRMILGDSLQVMASLARREDLAGKVQMLYFDPPYGIKFASNFQPEIGKRDVKDKEADLTREPEMIKAYRDTWTLGVHSYLAYLRDRLMLAKELLADTGSIFVQIGDENLHRVRALMDEVFGSDNFCSVITFRKTTSATSELIAPISDYLLWFAKDKKQVRFRNLYLEKNVSGETHFSFVEEPSGHRRRVSQQEAMNNEPLPTGAKVYTLSDLAAQHSWEGAKEEIVCDGRTYGPGKNYWKTNRAGLERLIRLRRAMGVGTVLRYVRYADDFSSVPLSNTWADTSGATEKHYVVQTSPLVIERCMLMTTDPGDLVLDPTCGSGTTAYVAEQWGRRWITIDTSRVALSLARQWLLTAKFDFYKMRPVNADDLRRNPLGPWLPDANGKPSTFACKTVPHVMLKTIAQNVALDAIFAKHQPVLDAKLAVLNAALKKVTPAVRTRLATKLAEKEKRDGKKAVTDADRRRWILPCCHSERSEESQSLSSGHKPETTETLRSTQGDKPIGWQEWQVPFDTDNEWPAALQSALTEYRAAWRAKMDEVNACIEASAEQEELVDDPDKLSGVVRVSGPFTMEAVMPAEESLGAESPIGGEPESLETFGQEKGAVGRPAPNVAPEQEPQNAEAYLHKILRLLKADGVRFPNNKVAAFTRLEAVSSGDFVHAEGEWSAEPGTGDKGNGKERRVAVSFGPQFGPVTAYQVENALHHASRRGCDDLVFAGFSFDGSAQAIIQYDPNPKVRCHLAHIRPDVTMGDLLKETAGSQIFTVFGSVRPLKVTKAKDGQYTVEMEGVDIYNPVENTIQPTNADKVAAWFLDGDYDGRTFCITQAFFPDKSAWEKLAKALKGVIDEERFEALSGTVSLPFPVGKHKRCAVKVIDPRGNEVMRVHRLDGKTTY